MLSPLFSPLVAPMGEIENSEAFWFNVGNLEYQRPRWNGSVCIGEHGPEFAPHKERAVEAEAILSCGRRLQFTVAPVTGEKLYCSRCDKWEECRVPGGLLFRCDTCKSEPEAHYGHNSTLVMARARKHRVGRNGTHKNNPHLVMIGTYTENDVIWKPYEKGMEL